MKVQRYKIFHIAFHVILTSYPISYSLNLHGCSIKVHRVSYSIKPGAAWVTVLGREAGNQLPDLSEIDNG